jgi:Uma2 family endonuclease
MGQPAEKFARRATYADLEAVPSSKVAELIHGTLQVMPRPAPRHARTSSILGAKLTNPFDLGDGGPGGWWLLDEPELHFPDPEPQEAGDVDVLVPDIAGWRRARMPELPETAFFELAPDWVCEVLSTSTERVDRDEKMPIYAREGVAHAWLLDPIARTLEAYTLGRGRRWGKPAIHRGEARVALPPFEALTLDLSSLWA